MASQKKRRQSTRLKTEDDVARHLGRSRLEIDPHTGAVIGVLNTAFALRVEKGEKEASVNHLQHFVGDVVAQLKAIKADMTAAGYTVGSQSAYAVVMVQAVENCGKRCNVALAVYKRPEPKNESHSELRGLPADNSNLEILEALAQEASKQLFLVVDL